MASSSPKIDPAEAASAFLKSQAALAQERIDLQRFNDEIAHLKEAKGQAAVEERIQQEQRKWRDADIHQEKPPSLKKASIEHDKAIFLIVDPTYH